MSISSLRRKAADEDGSATIEAVLWLPFFIMLFIMIADAAMIFANQSRVHRMVQDGNRNYVVGAITNCAALETWLENVTQQLAPSASATCSVSSNIVTSTVSIPSGELDLSGATGVFGGLTIQVQAQHLLES